MISQKLFNNNIFFNKTFPTLMIFSYFVVYYVIAISDIIYRLNY